ncbi:MAG TPA: prolipoprotein diacylglyceryl transferase family protein [Abditibacteriaceae bacterium]|jgi:phosphatidylglycerol:prolipoprotein diacylglycerol transferase
MSTQHALGAAFTTAAYVVGAAVFYFAARQRRLATEGMGWLALAGLCGGIVGAKLTEWVLMHPALLRAQPLAFFNPALGGRTLIGGVLVGWLCVEIAKQHLGIRRSTGDLFALALPAGEAVGRVGCFFNSCCFGVPTKAAFAVWQHDAWRHPTQLYLAFVAAAIFVVLWQLRNHMRHEGDLFKLYLLLWASSRFVIEFLRQRDVVAGNLSLAQWMCLEIAVMSTLLLLRHRIRFVLSFGKTE